MARKIYEEEGSDGSNEPVDEGEEPADPNKSDIEETWE
jgi:hypothetical protein